MENFDIHWDILNFHFCWHKTGEWLESPLFEIRIDHRTFWRLRLYPRGEDDGEYISCYLYREEGGPEVVDVDFELFLKIGSRIVAADLLKRRSFKIHQRDGVARLAPRCLVLSPNAALKDTFVLRFGCSIFNEEIGNFGTSFIMMLATKIEMERIYGTEIFDDDKDIDPDYNKDIEVKPMLEDESLININLSYVEESLVIKIRPVSCKKIKYAVCKITAIKNSGKESSIEHVRSWIGEIKADTWRYRGFLPETVSSTPDFKNSTDKAFYVHYDFVFSTGETEEICESEYYAYITDNYFPLQQYFNESIKTADSAPTALDTLKSLCFSESFVDFGFKSKCAAFHVHKAIICARCPTLKSVINSNHTAAELIPLDADVGGRLISFLYTDSVELSLWLAAELYSIASFLRIELLKSKCRTFLIGKLNFQRLGNLLYFLPSLGEFSLKSAIENFIVTHYDLVLHSMNWKYLKDEPELRKEIILLKYKKQKTIQMYNVEFE